MMFVHKSHNTKWHPTKKQPKTDQYAGNLCQKSLKQTAKCYLKKYIYKRCSIDLPSTWAGLTGSIRETISARSVKEALGQVTTCRTTNWSKELLTQLTSEKSFRWSMAYTVALRFVEFFLMSVLHHLFYHATPAPHVKHCLPMLVPHFLFVHTATHANTHVANQNKPKKYRCKRKTEYLGCRR